MTTSSDRNTFAARFDQFGYGLLRDAITSDVRTSLRIAAQELLASPIRRGRDPGADGKDGFRGCLALNPTAFLPLVANGEVLPVVVELLSPNIHVLSTQLIALPSIPTGHPREMRTPARPGWHRDMFGVAADLRRAAIPRMAIKCAYYLTDITPEAGLTMFLPGSHLHNTPPNIPAGQIDPLGPITPGVGASGRDAVLFENRTWHAGGVNTSGRTRVAIMIQYGYRWLAPVDDPAPELLHRTDLDDVQRQLLGARDRNPDGSMAKGLGALPLQHWMSEHHPGVAVGTSIAR